MKKDTQQIAVAFTTKDLDPYLEEIRNGKLKDFMDNGDPVRGAATLEYPMVDIEVNLHSKGQLDGEPGDQTPSISYFCCRRDEDGEWYSVDYIGGEPNVDWNSENWRHQLMMDMYRVLQEYVSKDGYKLCPPDEQLLQWDVAIHSLKECKESLDTPTTNAEATVAQHPYSIAELEDMIHGVIRFAGDQSLTEGYAYLEGMGFTQEQMRFFGFDVDGVLKELEQEYCDYYSEEKEAEIVIRVRNCDGVEVCYEYPTLEDLQTEWNKEHESPVIPMLDDQLLFGRVGETEVTGATAEDVFRYLKETCEWEY